MTRYYRPHLVPNQSEQFSPDIVFGCAKSGFNHRCRNSKQTETSLPFRFDTVTTYDVFAPHSFQTDLPSDTILLLIR